MHPVLCSSFHHVELSLSVYVVSPTMIDHEAHMTEYIRIA